jgi:hypothetical protein
MEPVVYDFAINENGTSAQLLNVEDVALPPGYYAMTVPRLVRLDPRQLSPSRRAELDAFGGACRLAPNWARWCSVSSTTWCRALRNEGGAAATCPRYWPRTASTPCSTKAFAPELRSGRIGLAQNRLPVSSDIRDVEPGDVFDAGRFPRPHASRGAQALRNGEVAVVRWRRASARVGRRARASSRRCIRSLRWAASTAPF